MSDGLVVANTYNGTITASIYSLPSNGVTNLLFHNQKIWIGTEYGLAKIDANLKKSETPLNTNATFVYGSTKTTQSLTPSVAPITNTSLQNIPKKRRSSIPQSTFVCDGRIYCSQMTSCEESKLFLKYCPNTKLDGDRDGIPCESQWCKPQ
jgi:hypothetical protein